jgi:hypothetical protein
MQNRITAFIARSALPFVVASALGVGAVGAQTPQSTDQVTVPLTEPARPGTLVVAFHRGALTIRGTNRKDMLVGTSSLDETRSRNREAAGLRRLTIPGGFVVEESNNEVMVSSGVRNGGVDLTIEVPARTNLKLSALNAGPIVVENVEGEIEANNQNQSITLTNVAGSVVAHATNGRVKVVMNRVTADKAMAFTSFNSDVDVTLPASTKANLRMRVDKGDIFTNFDVNIRSVAAPPASRRTDGRIRIEVARAIEGVVNSGGPEFEFRTFNGNIYVRKGDQ